MKTDTHDVSTSQGKLRISSDHQKPEESHGTEPPQEPAERHDPTDSMIQTCSLQNCERKNYCYFKLPSL